MKTRTQHMYVAAQSRALPLRSRKVLSLLVAFVLAFSLFPTAAFAASAVTTDAGIAKSSGPVSTYSAGGGQAITGEKIEIGLEPLNIIQNGNYDGAATPAITSTYASSQPSAAQREQIEARLEAALTNVSYGTYNGENMWCIVDVSDLKAPISSNATSYVKTVVESVIQGNPDLFYAGASYGAGTITYTSGSTSTVILSKIQVKYYYSPSSINSMKTSYNTAMKNVLSWVPASGTEAQKAKAVHDWLVRNCKYNWDAYLAQSPAKYGNWSPWSAYGAVVLNKPVCEGYSLAFIAAMKRLGIQATFVQNNGHGWNRVKVDGSWYNIDITWDDPLNSSNKNADGGFNTTPSTKYFLKSDKYFKGLKDGTHDKWTPAGVAGTSTKYDGTNSTAVANLGSFSKAATRGTVTSLTLSPTTATLDTNSTLKLALTVKGTNVIAAEAAWTSSNTNIVKVSSSGVISSAAKEGSAVVRATLGGKTVSCNVTVKKGAASATSIASATITLNGSQDLSYKSGTARKPALKVVVRGTTLTANTHYTVSYPSDSINPGTKTATVTGKGQYKNSKTYSYNVTAPLSGVKKSGAGWNNSNNTLTTQVGGITVPTLTFKGSLGKTITLKQGTDFSVTLQPNNTSVGTKTATIRGKGAWTGTFSYKLVIQPRSLSGATVTIADKVYTGKALKPAPVVKVGSYTFPTSSYTVTYSNNKNVGRATVTIKGKGNATGTVTKTFQILPKGTKIKKLAAAKKAITVTWTKQAKQTGGYQIQYSTSSTFKSGNKTVTIKKNSTTKYKISKLTSGKKYYLRIRTFKKVGGKTYYSAWSAKKSIKAL